MDNLRLNLLLRVATIKGSRAVSPSQLGLGVQQFAAQSSSRSPFHCAAVLWLAGDMEDARSGSINELRPCLCTTEVCTVLQRCAVLLVQFELESPFEGRGAFHMLLWTLGCSSCRADARSNQPAPPGQESRWWPQPQSTKFDIDSECVLCCPACKQIGQDSRLPASAFLLGS